MSTRLKNTYFTRVVVSVSPSGTRYDVEPGGVVEVPPEDVNYLLAMKLEKGGGCCGATPTIIKYFTEV